MSEQADTQTRFTWVLFAITACLLAWELSHLARWLPVITSDARDFYLPWYRDLLQMGRFHGVSGRYANYTPPTLYFFSLASLLNGLCRTVVLLKLINVPFVLASAVLAYLIARRLRADKMRAIAVALVVFLFPEVWQNAFHWGQYDLIYTTFLLATAYALLAKRVPLAMLCFGSALAFKLQAIFLGPALLALVVTGEVGIQWIPLIPLSYLVWMLPAAAAGRGWLDLLSIYREQSNLFAPLSVDAPNVYFLFQEKIAPGLALKQACHLADLLTVVAVVWIIWRYVALNRKSPLPRRAEDLVLLMTLSQLTIPYLLPHMHERYYFAGNLFAALLLASRFSTLFVVALLQTGTLAIYHQYFLKDAIGLTVTDFVLPVTAFTMGLLVLAWLYQQRTRTEPSVR